jgi:molybdenum cofactor cytidylyltransferase
MAAGTAAIVLAAGASRRMGTPKALLPWRNTTLLEYAVGQARLAGVSEVVVVLGLATRHVPIDATTVFNLDPGSGRSASIRLGAAALSDDVRAILLQSVDQPVTADIMSHLFEALTDEVDVAVPTYRGRRGHPVCVSASLLPELRKVSEVDEGLRAIVRRHAARLVEIAVDSESVVWNFNDPAAFAAAQATQ